MIFNDCCFYRFYCFMGRKTEKKSRKIMIAVLNLGYNFFLCCINLSFLNMHGSIARLHELRIVCMVIQDISNRPKNVKQTQRKWAFTLLLWQVYIIVNCHTSIFFGKNVFMFSCFDLFHVSYENKKRKNNLSKIFICVDQSSCLSYMMRRPQIPFH